MENKNKDVLQKTVRINRYLAMSGIASRRAAEEVVRAGEVRVNGKVVEDLGTQVDPGRDTVTVRGKLVAPAEHLVYVLLNKPKDYITTAKDEKDRRTVYDLLSIRERVFPIGRLDRNTTGVLLFTNDGFLATKLMHPSSEVKKEYHVSIDQSLDETHREKLSKGIFLDDGKTAPADVVPVPGTKNREIIVTIHEGRNRQVRRMFESLGYEIVRLHRISYGGVTADGVARGRWRFLTDQEIRKLKGLVALSDQGPATDAKKRPAKRKFKPVGKTFSESAPKFTAAERPSSEERPRFKKAGTKSRTGGSKFTSAGNKYSEHGSKFKSEGKKFSDSGSKFKSAGKKFSDSGSKFKTNGVKRTSSSGRSDTPKRGANRRTAH